MSRLLLKGTRWALALLIVLGFVWSDSAILVQPVAAQMGMGGNGIVCTSMPGTSPVFTLTTRTGYIGTPDDNVIYMWGFSAGMAFQHPSPILCVNEGDTVTVIVNNTLPEDVSIMFPGQDNVLANGAPAQPQFDGGGNLTSLTNVAMANGGSMTYSFVASHPGTFIYESGTNPAKQVNMGLFGAIIVRPTLGANFVNNRLDSQFNPDEEFLVLFSSIDPYLNQAVEQQVVYSKPFAFNLNNFKSRYWMINGRGFPDTLAPNFASWLPSQPYGALARVHPYVDGTSLPALDRFVNVGTDVVPMHPHAKNALILNKDGRPVEGELGEDLSWENFSVPVGPGETYDGLFKWRNAENYDRVTNPVPITVPIMQNMVYGMLWSGSPYLGVNGPFPVGATPMTECGEYYIIAHNHALFQITSWGIVMTGPITFLRVDPPLPNSCP